MKTNMSCVECRVVFYFILESLQNIGKDYMNMQIVHIIFHYF